MKNFANVEVFTTSNLIWKHEYTGNMFVYKADYDELLNAYRTLIDKMSEVVGDAIFEE